MTDPRYAARDITESAADTDANPTTEAAPGPEPGTDSEPGPVRTTSPDADGPADRTAGNVQDGNDTVQDGHDTAEAPAAAQDGHDTAEVPHAAAQDGHDTAEVPETTTAVESDPQATTELPRTGWGSQSGPPSDSQSGPPSGTQPGGQSGAGPTAAPSWSSDETHDFPAYRPQSYPTYPPTVSQTTELPAVGGPPPTSAAAYGGPGPGMAAAGGMTAGGMTGAEPARRQRRAGAGVAGALGIIGLAAAAYAAFALPVQKLGPRRSPYFVSLRELSTQKVASSQANAHSVSFAGGHAATLWWRYGLAGALGVLALLLLIQICVPVLRRVAGVLLFLGGLATIVGYAIGLHQTNDYRSIVGGIQGTHRLPTSQLGLGIWVAAGGCAVAALGGLIATVQSTRR